MNHAPDGVTVTSEGMASYELDCAIRSLVECINEATGATRARLKYQLDDLLAAQRRHFERLLSEQCCGGCAK